MSTSVRAVAYDGLIREIYLGARKGPLRVSVGQGSYPPFLEPDDVVLIEREPALAVVPGEFVGVREENGDIRVTRFVAREGEHIRLMDRAWIGHRPAASLIGPVRTIERGGVRQELAAARPQAALRIESLLAQARRLRHRLGLTRSLASVYWGLLDAFEEGVSETGDLLITERCPVGCRFCIYSCVTAGEDMDASLAGRGAAAFAAAGVPKVRLLGGEPFFLMSHLLACWDEVRKSYAADRVIILTSGYFATSDESTRAHLDPLVERGLVHLHVSFDAFHLERYPVSRYERLLAYASERGLQTALVVHYSAPLAGDLETLLALRTRYPFAVRMTTVSREGDAADLKDSETSVAGFDAFRAEVLEAPGMELISEERSCFRWTVFPSGAVHFCCKENEKNRVGNLKTQSFPEIQERLRRLTSQNRLNVLRFAVGPKGEVSSNACLSCPLEGQPHSG